MSRSQGFTRADIDVGFLDDRKMRRLAKRTSDANATNAAVVTYLAVLLASWEAGERVAADDELAPIWMDSMDIGPLIDVGLLDADGRIPAHAWREWYGPALERRLLGQRRAIYAGLRSSGLTVEKANQEADRKLETIRKALNQPRSTLKVDLKGQPHPTIHPTIHPTKMDEEDEGQAGVAAPMDGAPRRLNGETTPLRDIIGAVEDIIGPRAGIRSSRKAATP